MNDIETGATESQAEISSVEDALSKAYDEMMAGDGSKDDNQQPVEGEHKPAVETASEDKPVEQDPAETTTDDKPQQVQAPSSWSAAMREKFAELPEDVREQIVKREKDIDSRLRVNATQTKIAEDLMQVVNPHQQHLQELGVHPMQAIGELLNLGHQLKKGDAQTKAAIIGQLIASHSVDLTVLDDVLSKQVSQPKPTAAEQQMLSEIQQLKARLTPAPQPQQAATDINKAIEAFANDPKNEFFNEVAQDMQTLLQIGKADNLADAYALAIRFNGDVQKVLTERAAKQQARVAAANVSPKGTAPKPKAPAKKSTEQILSDAIDEMNLF